VLLWYSLLKLVESGVKDLIGTVLLNHLNGETELRLRVGFAFAGDEDAASFGRGIETRVWS
jgi:hypothetical protein